MIFVFDIDGTVADNSRRQGYIQGDKKDWDAFYRPELMEADLPISAAQTVLPKIRQKVHMIAFLTGRPERTREVTSAWIKKHFGIDCWDPGSRDSFLPTEDIQLIMRQEGDFRPANEYKEDYARWLGTHPVLLRRHRFFVDDDTRAFSMYWRYGIPLHAPGCWRILDP